MAIRLEAILENLKAALEGINGTGQYANVVKYVSRDFIPVEQLTSAQFPAVFLNVGPSDNVVADTEQVMDTPEIEVRVLVQARKDLSKALHSMVGDVYRAVMLDATRGALAMDTVPNGRADVDETSLAPRGIAGALMLFRIPYHHALGNMD